MKQRIYIGVAWPYANSPLHLGHIAGAYLPADIFARFMRMQGHDVLMASGSDMHGTPITLRADKEGVLPSVIAERYHEDFVRAFAGLGISFDIFTKTTTENHTQVAQKIFLDLYEKGYIYKDRVLQPYCATCRRFLPDRYVEGTCPHCNDKGARGDQCDNCGKPLNSQELKDLRCTICGLTPAFTESEHFFLKLSAFNQELIGWIDDKTYFRSNVYAFTKKYLEMGLKDRAITRDIAWGIPVPLPGYEEKRLYVWFEAVIGYLSASMQWAKEKGDEKAWQPYWQDINTRSYYFIGKDNIPFHTIIWPAMLMGKGNLILPYNVPANEYLTIEGRKLSSSRNWAVWAPDYLLHYQPDPLRYLLSINMPESSDTDFSWREFVRRNNDELVATYGNLVQRTLTFIYKKFNGTVPSSGQLNAESLELIADAQVSMSKVADAIACCSFREGIREAMALAAKANRYLEATSPWKLIKEEEEAAASALYTALAVLNALKIIFYPFLPHSSQKLHEFLGGSGLIEEQSWSLEMPVSSAPLREPSVLFTKLDESIIDEEIKRMG
ncbi:MAG: methionine--tRNA ligase [Chloroflexi bacterium]|nr:methionine--tRNA ligase [Chloroflexota bacterium]